MGDFIEVYPDAVSRERCREVVERFEASGQATRGRIGSGVDTALKNSFDIGISGKPEWAETERLLGEASFDGLLRYVRKHPFALVGALALRMPDAQTGGTKTLQAEDVAGMADADLENLVGAVFRGGAINLQKYLAGEGGYPHWHSEIYPLDERAEPLHRVLLWTIYLNDVPEAGETEFFHQQRKIKPCAGSLLIAPAGFTHTHRGNRPIGGDKHIATSWVLFQRSEKIFGR